MEVKRVFITTAHASPYDNVTANFSLCDILDLGIQVVFWIGVMLSIVFIAIGGIKYMSSQGDPKATETARKTLTNAVIGFVIVVGALGIRKMVQSILGINLDSENCDIGLRVSQ